MPFLHNSLLWLLVLWLHLAQCQPDIRNSSTDLVPIYQPHLSNLRQNPALFNPALGGQDWRMCCSLVVNESLVIENNTLYIRPGQTFFAGTINDLEEFPRYPCGAQYNGTLSAPHQQFWMSYSWCYNHCPGWPVTRADDLGKWLKPLIAFILPSLIFCLNVPRRRRLDLPITLFSGGFIDISDLPLFLIKVPLASLIVTVDIIIWTCVVFSVASPMITSGIYEALLDARVLSYLESRSKENTLSAKEKAHTLLSILIGNLDIKAWRLSSLFVHDVPGGIFRRKPSTQYLQTNLDTPRSLGLITPSHSQDASASNAPTEVTVAGRFGQLSYSVQQHRSIVAIKWRLLAMLDSQISFGTSVGAPVLFYIASFIWSVYEVNQELGSYVTAHQLAAGMFWMTIPHVALVSCLLLAGNNPNIWQNAVAGSLLTSDPVTPINSPRLVDSDLESDLSGVQNHDGQEFTSKDPKAIRYTRSVISRFVNRIFGLAYKESRFKPAWMWNRGSNKAMWIGKLAEEYPYLRGMREEVLDKSFKKDLWTSGFYGFILYFVPTFFSVLVSYTTPQPGFGCRSLLVFAYGVSQLILQLLWLIRWYFSKRGTQEKSNNTLYTVVKSASIYLWYFFFLFAIFLGAFTSIGGTIFVLTNVLTNCFCALPAKYWIDRWTNPDALIFVDDSTWEQLYYAEKWWFPAGVVGVVFMTIVAYIGWWYQRSLRQRYCDLVDKIDHISELEFEAEEGSDTDVRHTGQPLTGTFYRL
ncbi:uncharacterized protein F4812DRAFT_410949 [Daldinia caldariorum]|uniref:uncharacterized protein n=1 Tax=Daldinia caldariorum TaxID=326644 RepID=UPI0020078742|nr:uncharacterized protein F4812DRAFT_410949 [Daldinia caldariorum]KAI1472938.1 hypothetical protein F4812DRAFT_410949 [Daldinia caldariorum]